MNSDKEIIAFLEKQKSLAPDAKKYHLYNIAAKEFGVSVDAIRHRVERRGEKEVIKSAAPQMPELPDPDLPVDEVIQHLCNRFERRAARNKAERWMRIKMPDNRPFGVCFWGDPHLDNPGTNWPLLRHHAEIASKTEGMYSACVGDLVDNWVGRLMRLYADSDIPVSTGWRLVEWFFKEAGLDWLITVLGNHDNWNQGGQIIKAVAQNKVHVSDSDARFVLEAPNGVSWPVWVRHDFPGNSMWNTLHGMTKAAHMKESAALYICGHLHNWALHEEESASRGNVYWLARARGYKYLDQHATVLGHESQEYGASIVAICNPTAERLPGRMRCFPDVEEAADYLTYLRSKK